MRWAIGLIFSACTLASLWIYFSYFYVRPPTLRGRTEAPPEIQAPAPSLELAESDERIRGRAQSLSSHPKLSAWLKTKDILRRITAAASILAEGNSPRDSLNFLSPQGKFSIKKKRGKLYLDAKSYHRYDLLADVFQSLNVEAAIGFFEELKPLFQEACREQGCWERGFQDTLVRAILELLKTPIVRGEILLNKKIVSYEMADGRLEVLSNSQKHLLRMGPKNTIKIQSKLREIAQALGVPENELPEPPTVATKPRQ